MGIYSAVDYLCNEPFLLEGIGTVTCPTLRDIRKVTYSVFSIYLNILSISLEDYLKLNGLEDACRELPDAEKSTNTLFYFLLYGNTPLLFGILNLFLTDPFEFNPDTKAIEIFISGETGKNMTGQINNENFESFREELQNILGIRKSDGENTKFKNNLAKKMYAKFQKQNQQKKNKADENFELDNMIKKYCTHNKVGIHILNVWDLTYYQFLAMFQEYLNGRQYDFNDMMAANSFSFKKSADYKPMEYIKKIN